MPSLVDLLSGARRDSKVLFEAIGVLSIDVMETAMRGLNWAMIVAEKKMAGLMLGADQYEYITPVWRFIDDLMWRFPRDEFNAFVLDGISGKSFQSEGDVFAEIDRLAEQWADANVSRFMDYAEEAKMGHRAIGVAPELPVFIVRDIFEFLKENPGVSDEDLLQKKEEVVEGVLSDISGSLDPLTAIRFSPEELIGEEELAVVMLTADSFLGKNSHWPRYCADRPATTYVEKVLKYHLGDQYHDVILRAINDKLGKAVESIDTREVLSHYHPAHGKFSLIGLVVAMYLRKSGGGNRGALIEILEGHVTDAVLSDIERDLAAEATRTVFRDPTWQRLEERYQSQSPAGNYKLLELYKRMQESYSGMALAPSSTWLAGYDQNGDALFITAEHVANPSYRTKVSDIGSLVNVMAPGRGWIQTEVVAVSPQSENDLVVLRVMAKEDSEFVRENMLPLKIATNFDRPVFGISGYHHEVSLIERIQNTPSPFFNVYVATAIGVRGGYSGGPWMNWDGEVVGTPTGAWSDQIWIKGGIREVLEKAGWVEK